MMYTEEQAKVIAATAKLNPDMDWERLLQFCEEIVFEELGVERDDIQE